MGTMGERQAEALALIAQARPATASAAFRKAVGARSYLREIFATLARQQEPSASMLDLLRGDAASSVRYARLARTAEGFGWDWAICDDLRAPLWPVIQAAVDLMRSGPVTSVKQCGACRFLFVDTSKNGSRRWCSMEDCGKTAKMRRYVARRSVSRASALLRRRRLSPRTAEVLSYAVPFSDGFVVADKNGLVARLHRFSGTSPTTRPRTCRCSTRRAVMPRSRLGAPLRSPEVAVGSQPNGLAIDEITGTVYVLSLGTGTMSLLGGKPPPPHASASRG